MGVEETSMVRRKIVVSSGPGDFNKIRCSSLTYTMSCFKLLARLCLEIEVLIKKFFGGKGERAERCIGLSGRTYAIESYNN